METHPVVTWTLVGECPIPEDLQPLLVEGEEALAAYRTFRESAVFTSKRLVVRDAHGLTGTTVEVHSLPYASIHMWSSEDAGQASDAGSVIHLWTRAGHVKIKLHQDVPIGALDRLISHAVLNG